MDRDEKIKTVLDMQEHPEEFTEEALNVMLEDGEVRELMEATAQLKQAMIMEDERTVTTRRWLRMAASFVGILLVSGITFAAIRIVHNADGGDSKSPTQEMQISNSHHPAMSADTVKTHTTTAQTIIFDNVTLDSIAKDIAAYHHIVMDLQNGRAKELRFYFLWKQDDSLQEVVEKLNMFEHVEMAVENGKLIIR